MLEEPSLPFLFSCCGMQGVLEGSFKRVYSFSSLSSRFSNDSNSIEDRSNFSPRADKLVTLLISSKGIIAELQ